MLQNQFGSHKTNNQNSFTFKEKHLIGFELFGDLENESTNDPKIETVQNLQKSLNTIKKNDEDTTEHNTSIEKSIYELLNDEHDLDTTTASMIAKHLSNKLKEKNGAYPDGNLQNRDIVVKNKGNKITVSTHEETSWYDLENYENTYFTDTVDLTDEDIQEIINENIANKAVATSSLSSYIDRSKVVPEDDRWRSRYLLFQTEQSLQQINKEPLESDEYYGVPKNFTDRFNDATGMREAILTEQISDSQNLVKLFARLGINQRQFLEESFGSSFFGNLEPGVSAQQIFEFSNLSKKYDTIEDAQNRLQILAKDPDTNRKEISEITRNIRDIRALGEMLRDLEYHAPDKKNPDYISKINFSNALDAKSKEAFKDNPAIIMALMGYLYGLKNLQKEQYVSYSLNSDQRFEAFIEEVPARDYDKLLKAYQKIDITWALGSQTLTEGIQELSKPEYADVRSILDAAKLDYIGQGDSPIASDIASLIANPLNTGPINEDYETLTQEEMTGPGATAESANFVNRQYSQKAIYESILRDCRDFKTNQYDLTKLETNLKRYAEYGRLYIAQNPEALKENNTSLLNTQWPENTPLLNALADKNLIQLIRHGFLLEQKVKNSTKKQVKGLDQDLQQNKINPQELAHFLTGLHLDKDGLEKLGLGAALVINLDDAGNPNQNSIHVGGAANVLDPKESGIIITFSRNNTETGTEASAGTVLNPYTANIGFSIKGEISKNYHIRLNGGIGTFGPVLAASIGAGFGRDLKTYTTEHEEETIKEFYDTKGTVFEELNAAQKAKKSETEQMAIVNKIPHLKELHEYFTKQTPPLPEKQINEIFIGENGLANELQNNIKNYAVENTSEVGWEVGGGLAFVDIFGVTVPIPYAYISLELPTGKTIMRYSMPSDVEANTQIQMEDAIQAQLLEQAGTSQNLIVTSTKSGEVYFDKETGQWRINQTRGIPELGTLNADQKAKAKKLTEAYKAYGITFSEITDPAYTTKDGLKDNGYLAMELNTDFIGDNNVEVHVDPSASGIHLTTLGESTDDGKLKFAANVNGAKNLFITRRENLKADGTNNIIITITDKKGMSLEEIETKEPGYYHFQNNRMKYVNGTYFEGQPPTPDKLTLGGSNRNIENRLFNNQIITPEILNSSEYINKTLTTTTSPDSLMAEHTQTLNTLVKKLSTKDKKGYAAISTLKLKDGEMPNLEKISTFINTQYKKAFPGKQITQAEFQYLYEKITEETFVDLNTIKNKEAHINHVIGMSDRFIDRALKNAPTLKTKFTPAEILIIRQEIKEDFKIALQGPSETKFNTQSLKDAGLIENYFVSTAANQAVGLENKGYRYVDTNDDSSIKILENSITQYSLTKEGASNEEKLVAKFILELSDPIESTSNAIDQAHTLLGSQLAIKLATLPIGMQGGKTINFLALKMGPQNAQIIADLINDPLNLFSGNGQEFAPEMSPAYNEFLQFVKEIRQNQIDGKPYKFEVGEGNNKMQIEMNMPTQLSSLLLSRCGNTTFASHEGIEIKVTNAQGEMLGGYAENKLHGYKTTESADTAKLTLGLSVQPDVPTKKTPGGGGDGEGGKEPTPRPDDTGGSPAVPKEDSKTVTGGGGTTEPSR